MSMNKFSWAEMVAATGVIASLVFVGMQIQQSNALGRLQAQQAMGEQWSNVNLTMATSPELASLVARVREGELADEFTSGEQYSLYLVLHGLDHTWEMYFLQSRSGVLENGDLSFPSPGNKLFGAAFHREMWPSIRGSFGEELAAFWEQRFGLSDNKGY